jgi:hypothetical protein
MVSIFVGNKTLNVGFCHWISQMMLPQPAGISRMNAAAKRKY